MHHTDRLGTNIEGKLKQEMRCLAGGSWGADNCGGGPINNNRTISVLGGIKAVVPADLKLTYAPGAPIADCE